MTSATYVTLVRNIISAGRDLFGLDFYEEHLPTKDLQNSEVFIDAIKNFSLKVHLKIPDSTWKGMDLNHIRKMKSDILNHIMVITATVNTPSRLNQAIKVTRKQEELSKK